MLQLRDSMNSKRLRKKRQARRRSIESLEDRRMLAGLQVVDVNPEEMRNSVFDHVEVSFNQEIDAATFTEDDVSISGPTGDIEVDGIEVIDADTFRVDFAVLPERGNYEIVIGPDILDLDGDALDGDARDTGSAAPRLAPEALASQRDERSPRQPGAQPLLYEEIFFHRRVKLQYPPTSLLMVDALRREPLRSLAPKRDLTSDESLNSLSWYAVLLTALLSAAVLVLAASGFAAPHAPLRGADRVVLALFGVLAGLTFYPLVRAYYLGQVQTFIDALIAAR